PHSPDSAELSTISLPNSGPHDTILSDPMPPRPSSEGDQPSSTNTKSFKCTKCPYVTDRKNNLKRHMTTMHDPAPSTLDCCGTRFATKGDLRDHTKAAHGAGYTCWQCGHNFCRRALLQRHQSVHSGHKAFSCSKCGYQSSHKSNMQRHMQVHLQAKASDSPGLKDR
ncbi:Zinc finger C2H2-type, partial [Trinorchestia longiramus]